MLYAGYKFEINEAGLFMADLDEMVDLDKTPLKEGDVFILVRGEHGEIMFVKDEQLTQQMDRNHNQGL